MALAASPVAVAVEQPVPGAQPSWWRWALAAPDLVAVAVAGFAAPAMLLLLAGQLHPAAVLALGTAGAVVACAVCGASRSAGDRRTVLLTLAAGALVVAWAAVNMRYSAQNLYAHRDPATYGLTGRWLMDHPSLPIPTHPEVFGSPEGYSDTSAGFGVNGYGTVYAQGNHLLPVMLAAAGWVFGAGAVLKANVAIGAAALFVFFGLARRVVGAPLGLVAMAALAVSMPMIYVSRDSYSEPLAMLLLLGGVSLLCRAVQSGRAADFALAGFIAGSAACARIDSNVSLLSLIVVAAALAAVAPPGRRRGAGLRSAALLAGAVPVVIVGWLDVTRLSSGYYHDERHQIIPIGAAAVSLAVLGVLAVAVAWRSPKSAPGFRITSAVWLGRAVVALPLLVFAVLASRPMWMTSHGSYNAGLKGTQLALGLPPEPNRTYNEHTLDWQAMYLGWTTVLLAAVGYCVLTHHVVRRRQYALLGVLAMGAAMSGLYLWTSEITPDHPWAMRRYVPVVIPLLLVAACTTLGVLSRRSRPARALAVVGAAALLVVPAVVTAPVASLREEYPQLAQVQALCSAITPSGAVISLDATTMISYGQTLRSYCGVPALGLLDATDADLAAARAAAAAHGRRLLVMSADISVMHFAGPAPGPFSAITTTRWPSTLVAPPRTPLRETVTIYLAAVRPDGLLDPVVP